MRTHARSMTSLSSPREAPAHGSCLLSPTAGAEQLRLVAAGGFSSHFMQGFMPKDNSFCGLLQLFCSFILLITM